MSEINNTPSSIDEGIPEVEFTLQVSEVVQAPVDDTLSIAGEAADAKATGDAITAAKAELTEDIEDLAQTTSQNLTTAVNRLQGEIDNISGDADAVKALLFPVGCIYVSTSSSAPTFGKSDWEWKEIVIPATWGDIEDGMRSYEEGTGTGTLHLWKRTK